MTAIFKVCDPSPLAHGVYTETPFVTSDMRKRTDPAAVMAGVQSIVVVAVGHSIVVRDGRPQHCDFKQAELSSLGTNADYHPIVRTHLADLTAQLKELHGDFKHKILVDSGTLDERTFAVRAGIGFLGRHGVVVAHEFGTRFNIGLLLTTLPMDAVGALFAVPESIARDACPANCNLCIVACPTNALRENQPLDHARCLSYLTQKKELTAEEGLLLAQGNQLYGCDICQNACPFNAPQEKTYVSPFAWLHKTDADFESEFGHTAMLWQGTELLRRNAKIICDFHRGGG